MYESGWRRSNDVLDGIAAASSNSVFDQFQAGRTCHDVTILCQAIEIVVSREVVPLPQNVVNLMYALRRSIAEERAASLQPTMRRKRNEGQGGMLLPIAGKAKKAAESKAI